MVSSHVPLSGRAALQGALGVVFLLGLGCKVGPNYQPPQVKAGGDWSHKPEGAGAVALDAWWRQLGDPVLDRLVEAALQGNLDLRQAQARILEARALRDAVAGAKAPTVSASAGVTREEQSLNGPLPIGKIPGMTRDITVHEVGFDASWELDLFGRTRRRVESAQAQAQAAVEEARDVRVSVAAEVARTYLTMRGAQRELEARSLVVAALRQSLETLQRRAAAGDVAAADVDRAQAQFQDASAVLPGLRAQMHASALGLGALLGQLPESEAALCESRPAELALAPFPVGERADVLRRRPDVRAAERALASATAEIGVAKAEWFPKLSISASAGFQALAAADLFKSTSQALMLAPLISWRIFDGGTIRAQIRASEARQQEAALGYEKAVLGALTDAERSLATYRLALEATQAQQASLDAARRTFAHAERRFKLGDIALGERLEAERSLREAEDSFVRAQTAAAIDLVALCKALGGGWREEPEARKS
jgi:NodT family efflux transporter outer membrane factor (OMF) lipoprotein